MKQPNFILKTLMVIGMRMLFFRMYVTATTAQASHTKPPLNGRRRNCHQRPVNVRSAASALRHFTCWLSVTPPLLDFLSATSYQTIKTTSSTAIPIHHHWQKSKYITIANIGKKQFAIDTMLIDALL